MKRAIGSWSIIVFCVAVVGLWPRDDVSQRELQPARESAAIASSQVVERPLPLAQPDGSIAAEVTAPSLNPAVPVVIEEHHFRFAMERILAGDREMAVLFEVYREKLKKAEFEAEVFPSMRSNHGEASKESKVMDAMLQARTKAAEAQVNEARLAIKQMVYHRRRNAP